MSIENDRDVGTSSRVFVSTGLYKGATSEAARSLLAQGVNALELSSGSHEPDARALVDSLLGAGAVLQPHNYFPAPATPFVLNLCAADPDLREQSVDFVKRAVALSVACGTKRYSFHAGFLGNPRVADLGHSWNAANRLPVDEGVAIFQNSVWDVFQFAHAQGVQIAIENNVLTRANAEVNGPDLLLMTTPEGIEQVFEGLPPQVSLLLDVAHLRVSSVTLGFSAQEAMSTLDHLVGGYHLSDNDALSDSNDPVSTKSWFWDFLNPHVEYATLEIKPSKGTQMDAQVRLCEKYWLDHG